MRLPTLLALAAASSAAVELKITKERPVNPQLFGLNSILGSIYPIGFQDERLLAAVRTISAGSWRYPGGTVADYYDIIEGNYLPTCNPQNCSCCSTSEQIAADLPPRALSGVNFSARFLPALEAEGPIWDLNVFTKSPEEAAMQVQYLKSIGPSRVKHIELGNEFYLPGYDWRFSTPSQYIEWAKPTIEAAASELPGSTVAVVASQIRGTECGSWNEALAKVLPPSVKAVTMHDYKMSNSTVSGVSGPDWRRRSFVLGYAAAAMSQASAMLGRCFGRSDLQIWQTEYGYAGGDGSGFGKWSKIHGPLYAVNGSLHGMYIASRMLHAVSDPAYGAVDVMCALAVDSIGWGRTAGLLGLRVDFEARPPRVLQVNATGQAQIYAHLASLAAPSRGVTSMAALEQATAEPSLNVSVSNITGLPCFSGALFRGSAGAGVALAVLNRCPDGVQASVPGLGSSHSGSLSVYDAYDEGGTAPLPPEGTPHPWGAPLRPRALAFSASSGAVFPPLSLSLGTLTGSQP